LPILRQGLTGFTKANPPLEPPPAAPRQQRHRHGVQHLVANHHAAQRRWQRVGPGHARAMGGQALALARPQGARDVDDGVARQRLAQRVQRLDQPGRQRARAGAELPHLIGTGGRQAFGQLHRQRPCEQR